MIDYNSPVKTNGDLKDELESMLTTNFEEGIINGYTSKLSKYVEDRVLNDNMNLQIAQFYMAAKDAYIEALASILMYPEAIEYIY